MEAERDINMSVERAAKGDVKRDRTIEYVCETDVVQIMPFQGVWGYAPPPPPEKLLPLWAGEKNFIRSQTGVLLLKFRHVPYR